MMAIIIKEVREKLRWAGLIVLVLSSLLAWALRADRASGMSMVGDTMSIVSVIAFPAAGFALGLLAILSDARRGRWQFVMHRPIERWRIFAAKVFAGAALYLIATLLPLLTAYAWAATPGHVPGPVTPDMILPRLADLLGGLMWLAAGLLIASRSARWAGSRKIAAGFALIVSVVATLLTMHFSQFVVIIAGAIAVLLPPACIAFVDGGELPRKRWLVRTLAAVSLAAGWAVVVAVGCFAVTALMEIYLPISSTSEPRYYQVLDDGRIVICGWDGSPATDLRGNSTGLYAAQVNQHSVPWVWLSLGGQRPEEMPFGERESEWGFHGAGAHLRLLSDVGQHRELWFYVNSLNSIDGYGKNTLRIVGSMWPHGWSFSSRPFPEQLYKAGNQRFSAEPENGAIVAGTHAVWRLDFEHRSIRRIFVADPGDEILDAAVYAVATRQAIFVFKDGQTPVRIPLAYSSPAYSYVDFGRTIDGRWVLAYIPQENVSHPAPQAVVFASADGKATQNVVLPDLPMQYSEERLWYIGLPALAIPPAGFVAFIYFESVSVPHFLPIAWTVALCAAGLSALASIPLARRRQYSKMAIAGWAVLNLLLGIPGVLLLLSMDDPVPVVNCNACGHKRPITRGNCPRCDADFPPPARTGIEVFATP